VVRALSRLYRAAAKTSMDFSRGDAGDNVDDAADGDDII
jgi:hypothetical protein